MRRFVWVVGLLMAWAVPAAGGVVTPTAGAVVHEVDGLRVVVVPEGGEPSVTLWVQVAAGSADERDEERGASAVVWRAGLRRAMASDDGGTTLGERLALAGVRHGVDVGAYATLDHAAVWVSVPVREDGGGVGAATHLAMLMIERTLEAARGEGGAVADEAWVAASAEVGTTRAAVGHAQERTLAAVFPGSMIADRWPLPSESAMSRLTPERAAAYARRALSGGRVTLAALGPIEPDGFVGWCGARFGPLVGVSAPRGSLDCEPRVGPVVVPGSAGTPVDVGVLRVLPRASAGDGGDEASGRAWVLARLVQGVIERRAAEGVAAGLLGVSEVEVSPPMGVGDAQLMQVGLTGPTGGWRPAAEGLGVLIGSLREHAVTRAEFDAAAHGLAERAWAGVDGRLKGLPGAVAAAGSIAMAACEGGPTARGEAGAAWVERVIRGLTPADVTNAARAIYDPEASTYVVRGGWAEAAPDGPAVLDAIRVGLGRSGASDLRPALVVPALPAEGGVVRTVEAHAPTGVLTATLGNGVTVRHRRMGPPGRVVVSVSLWGGEIEETALTRGLTAASGEAVRGAAGTLIGLGSGAEVDVDAMSLRCSVEAPAGRLEEAVAAVRAALIDSTPKAADLERWRQAERVAAARRASDAGKLGVATVRALGRPADRAAAHPVPAERVETVRLDAVSAWLARVREAAPISVSIVGDVDAEAAVEAASRGFGGLGTRDARPGAAFGGRRTLRVEPWAGMHRVEAAGDGSGAFVLGGFAGLEEDNIRRTRAYALACVVLERMLIDHLERGADPGARLWSWVDLDRAYPGHSRVVAGVRTTPERVEAVRGVLGACLHALPTEGERWFDEARAAVLRRAGEGAGDPVVWAGRLHTAAWRADELDAAATLTQTYADLRWAEVAEAWSRGLERGVFEVVVTPRDDSGAGAHGGPGGG